MSFAFSTCAFGDAPLFFVSPLATITYLGSRLFFGLDHAGLFVDLEDDVSVGPPGLQVHEHLHALLVHGHAGCGTLFARRRFPRVRRFSSVSTLGSVGLPASLSLPFRSLLLLPSRTWACLPPTPLRMRSKAPSSRERACDGPRADLRWRRPMPFEPT